MKKYSVLFVLTLAMFLALTPLAAAANGNTGSIVRVAGNIVVEKGQVVHGDVVAVMGNIEVDGTVYGNVVAVLGNVSVSSSGSVLGDTVSVVGGLQTAPGSSISGGKVNVIGNGDFRGVRVPEINFNLLSRQIFRFNLVREAVNLMTSILLAVLIVALFPVPVSRARRSIEANPVRMALFGLLAWVVVVPLIILVGLTIIGIPLSILMGAAVWIAGRLGTAALVLIIGRALLKETESESAVAAVGALLLGVVAMIPLIGSLVGLIVSLITLGAATVTRFGTRDEALA